MSNINITGGISGTSVQVGDNNQATINLSQENRDEISALIEALRNQIRQAQIPEATKENLTREVLPALNEAVKSPDPKPGLSQGLKKLNDHLQDVETTTEKVSGILGTVMKIASIGGIAIKGALPFLAKLLF
jgi:glutamine synthetase adenylyltransferase